MRNNLNPLIKKPLNYKKTVAKIRTRLEEYVVTNNLKALVLGISGGIDSALCAAIAYPVCKKLKIPLVGRSITIETNKYNEIKRSMMVGEAFCTDFKVLDYSGVYARMSDEFNEQEIGTPADITKLPERTHKIINGNMKARIRMIKIYELAAIFKGLVLSTDNFTELMLGFWTLHGDVGDLGIIQQFWKTEVYGMAKYIAETEFPKTKANNIDKYDALTACINALPTDGLGITNSDLDQLGAKSYYEVDRILKIWLTESLEDFQNENYLYFAGRPTDYEAFKKLRASFENHPVVQRKIKSTFKRNNPLNFERNTVAVLEA